MKKAPLTPNQITIAIIIAALADILQVPATIAFLTGILAIPAHAAIVAVDVIAMIATCWLVGFHWLLLPSLVLHAVGYAAHLRDVYVMALWLTRLRRTPRVKNFKLRGANVYSP